MTATETLVTAEYRQAEAHRFTVKGEEFLYLVPSGAVFGLSGLSKEIFDLLGPSPCIAGD